jgi:hypothetical protein
MDCQFVPADNSYMRTVHLQWQFVHRQLTFVLGWIIHPWRTIHVPSTDYLNGEFGPQTIYQWTVSLSLQTIHTWGLFIFNQGEFVHRQLTFYPWRTIHVRGLIILKLTSSQHPGRNQGHGVRCWCSDAVTLTSTMRTDWFELASSALTSSTLKWLHRIQCGFKLDPCKVIIILCSRIV